MHGKAASVLAQENRLGQGLGHEALMTWKDEVTCVRMKALIEEKKIHVYQRARFSLLIRCHVSSDNTIKMLNPTVQQFKLLHQNMNGKTKVTIKEKDYSENMQSLSEINVQINNKTNE